MQKDVIAGIQLESWYQARLYSVELRWGGCILGPVPAAAIPCCHRTPVQYAKWGEV